MFCQCAEAPVIKPYTTSYKTTIMYTLYVYNIKIKALTDLKYRVYLIMFASAVTKDTETDTADHYQ